MRELALIADHAAEAKARLLDQYRNKPKLVALLKSFTGPAQKLELVFFQLLEQRHLNTASGLQLDRLGDIVGIERGGLSDEAYRLRIRARILVNISEGDPESLILIFKLLSQAGLVIFQEWPTGLSLMGDGTLSAADALAVYDLLESAAVAGVRVEGIGSFDAANPLTLAGMVLPYGDGLGSIYSAGVGGKLASLYVVGKEFALAGNNADAAGLGSIYDSLVGGRLVGL